MHFYRQSPTNNTKSVSSEKRLDVSVISVLKICHICLEYPSKIGATLEMVQRYHMKIHPASGGKSKKTKNKVLNLMKKIDV
ncbi:hypothetical protein JTB14_003990 [Gonioctena quinquepunctata]|nr:hypothetical protein JTB14_003990 [Gonioctena quinquepunctata]